MRLEHDTEKVTAFTIFDPPDGLDPISVVMRDFGPGNGQLFIDCFGASWSHYWGAMGHRRIGEFVASCSPDYIVCKLLPHGERRILKREEKYLTRIVRVVVAALRPSGGKQS